VRWTWTCGMAFCVGIDGLLGMRKMVWRRKGEGLLRTRFDDGFGTIYRHDYFGLPVRRRNE
jgi:hypothetical protein